VPRVSNIEAALRLSNSRFESTRQFAWSCVAAELNALEEPIPLETATVIENTALAAASTPSLSTLRSLYLNAPSVCHQRLFTAAETLSSSASLDEDMRFALGLAILATMERDTSLSDYETKLKPLDEPKHFTPLVFAVVLLKFREHSASLDIINTILDGLPTNLEWEHAVALLTIVECLSSLVKEGKLSQSIELLRQYVFNPIDAPIGHLIQDAALKAIARIDKHRPDLNTLIGHVHLKPKIAEQPMQHGAIIIIPMDSQISAEGQTLIAAPPVPIETITGPGTAGMIGLTPEWKAIPGSTHRVGSAYNVFSGSAATADTPGVTVMRLGIQHKTWRRVGGNGTIRYKLRVAYQAQPSSLWIAARWRGAADANPKIECVSGELLSGMEAGEADTEWRLHAVIPGKAVEFEVTFNAAIMEQSGNMRGIIVAKRFEECVEILEFNALAIDSFIEARPIDIGASLPRNALLSYVANVERATRPGGWLTPPGVSEVAASLAVARFAVLCEISKIDVSNVPEPPPPNAPARERQLCLKVSLPALAQRVFNTFANQIERDVLLLNGIHATITLARINLIRSLQVVGELTADQIRDALNQAAEAASLEQDDTLDKLDELVIVLRGAEEFLRDTQHKMLQRLQRGCTVISFFNSQPSPFPIVPDPVVNNMCKPYLHAP
jgi:hypothetical protein